MYLIVGLGNPGNKYRINRHNIGFLFLDFLSEKNSFNPFKKRTHFQYSLNRLEKEELVFIKPTTYMNLSGTALVAAMAFFKIRLEKIIIIYDDVALPFETIRIRESGSSGGHNGIKDIQQKIGTDVFDRIRIGVGAPQETGMLVSHVLSDFSPDELTRLRNQIFPRAHEALNLMIQNKTKEAMNRYNGNDPTKSTNPT